MSVWDLRTRTQVARMAEQEGSMRAVFSPTEPLLAFAGTKPDPSGRHENKLHLWNPITRRSVADVPLDNYCKGLAFSEDGKTLATSTYIGHIVLWRVSDQTQLASYKTDQGGSVGTAFVTSKDLGLAAYGSLRGVHVIDLHDGKEIWSAPTDRFPSALALSPDEKTLAVATGAGQPDIRLLDFTTGKQTGLLKGCKAWVGSMTFWPDGKKLVSSSADQTIRIWDVSSSECLDTLRGHREGVWRVVLLADGKTLVSGSEDGSVCFWDASATHKKQRRFSLPMDGVAWRFAPDSQSVFTLDWDGGVSRWTGPDFQRREALMSIPAPPRNRSRSLYLFSRDGRVLAAGSTNGVLQVWDVWRGVLLRQLTNTANFIYPQAFLGGGEKLVTWSRTGNLLREWNVAAGEEIQSWEAPVYFGGVSLSPDEQQGFAWGDEGGEVLRNLSRGASTNLNLGIIHPTEGRFSPDGKLFVLLCHHLFARVWDTATWQPQATLTGFVDDSCYSTAFSPNGGRLLCSNHDKQAVMFWDTKSWQQVFALDGGLPYEMAFSPDGNIIGAMNEDGTMQFWRAPTWEEIKTAEAADKGTAKSE
jgi:WD40 repeat protein